MDGIRFDRLTRSLGTAGSRRRALAGLVAGALGLLSGGSDDEAAAHDLKAKCKKKSGTAKKKCLKKAKKHAATHASESSPPPPPEPRCPQSTAPHWCASTNTCVPACPPGKVFEPASCTCVCAVEGTCCECKRNGSHVFCSAEFTTTEACFIACFAAVTEGAAMPFFSATPGMTTVCDATAVGGCNVVCAPDACEGRDACLGQATPCGTGGRCFQPFGGGPTRCGTPTTTSSCGCTSHEDCAEHGPGAFCVQDTGTACTGCAEGTFCATPR